MKAYKIKCKAKDAVRLTLRDLKDLLKDQQFKLFAKTSEGDKAIDIKFADRYLDMLIIERLAVADNMLQVYVTLESYETMNEREEELR